MPVTPIVALSQLTAIKPILPLQIPASLPKISAPTAAEICQTSQPSPAAQALLKPEQSPSQYLGALQDHQMGDEMVKTLAHGLPDREGVMWAAKSAEKVADKVPPADAEAMLAAQEWAKNPNPDTQAAAAAAAAKTDYQGPGAWAAQGAAWAVPEAPAAAEPGAVAAPRMTPHAVSGAVLLASAIAARPEIAVPKVPSNEVPKPELPELPEVSALELPTVPPPTVPPDVKQQMFKEQQPFIAMGVDAAAGKMPMG